MLFSPIEVLEQCIEERVREAARCDKRIEEYRAAILNAEREKISVLDGVDEYRAAIKRLADTSNDGT